jgi:predicted dienelactone hydrolase
LENIVQNPTKQLTQTLLALMLGAFTLFGHISVHAQFSAGFQSTKLATSDTENIDIAIWYPTTSAEVSLTLGPSTMMVSRGSPIEKKHPLALISHGTGGMNLNHHEIASALARAGFIVVALTHLGDNFRDRSMVGKLEYFTERPRQVSRTLDAFLADPKWRNLIDENRIAFVGHSAGGFTGLALLGATPSIANTVKHCATNYDEDLWFCNVSGSKERAIENAKNVSFIPTIQGSKDPRFKAAVLIAPVGAFNDSASLALVNTPTLVYVASKDTVLIPKFHAQAVSLGIPNADVITNANGGHFMLVSKLNVSSGTGININGTEVNEDPPGFNRNAAITQASTAIPKWLGEKMGL